MNTDFIRLSQTARWLVLLLSTGAMVGAAHGDLWFDEVWSIFFAWKEVRSLDDAFFIFHDNNHPLNTIYLHLLGMDNQSVIYRLPAIACGLASTWIAGHLAEELWGEKEALCSTLLIGTSYPLLIYFSEARGYAMAIFFALASFALLRKNLIDFNWIRLILIWLFAILGTLAHATFIIVGGALASWNLWIVMVTKHEGQKFQQRRFLLQQAVPLVFYMAWYAFFLRRMMLGGSDTVNTWAELCRSAALFMGFPLTFGPAAMLLVGAILIVGIHYLRCAGSTEWILYMSLLAGVAAMGVAGNASGMFQFRYMIVVFPFFYLLMSSVVCSLYATGMSLRRWAILLGIICIIGSQCFADYRLIRLGRGAYSSAWKMISENSPPGIIYIASDHDFRNRLLLEFYAMRAGDENRIRYVPESEWKDFPPEWYIKHSQNRRYRAPDLIALPGIGEYALVSKKFGFSGVSGWAWFVYYRKP